MEIKKINPEDTWKLRHEVMWPDKKLDYIKLKNDNNGIHYGLFINNKLISVISLFISEDNTAQFRKFATLKSEQRKGYGSKLIEFLIKEAEKLKIINIWCNARIEKIDFYKRFGLEKTDETFEKSGKKYIIMEKKL